MSVDLPHNCQRISFRGSYDANPRESERISYGRWTEANTDGEWFLCNELSYSDYSGTKPTYESNVRVFADMFSKGEGTWWVWADGGHDTTAIVIRTLAYRNASEVREIIDGLSDYPLLDESDSSDLECEREQEGWNDYGRDDFRRSLKEYAEFRFRERGDGASADLVDERVDELTNDQLDALYRERCEQTNGGGTCMFEGESHPHFFIEEVLWGRNGRSWKKTYTDDAWDGFVPALGADGEVDYHTGEIVDFSPLLDVEPRCPRCLLPSELSGHLWDESCGDDGCDVPAMAPRPCMTHEECIDAEGKFGPGHGMPCALETAKLAERILRTWPHTGKADVDAWGPLRKRVAESGDMRAALVVNFRDPDEAYTALVGNRLQKMVRAVLRDIMSGVLLGPPCNTEIGPSYMQDKPLCCILHGSHCCEHGKDAKTWCPVLSSGSEDFCPVHGTREDRRDRVDGEKSDAA